MNANRITVFLPEGETFTGKLNIDMSGYNQDGVYKQFSLVCPEIEGFNIDGTLEINGVFVNIRGINFTAKDDVTTSYNDAFGGNAKIGVIAYDSNGEVNCGGFIFNSTFTGYDYGVMSTYKGLVADEDGSVFDDCGYGIYMDCHSQNLNIGGDGSKGNTFVNCTKSAVAIISTPGQLPPYSLRFTENYFYNNTGTCSDFMPFNTEGVYYFQNNYYGKVPNVFTMDNLRIVNINYGNTQYSQIVTNPCIRYLGSEHPLGIEPAKGLYTRIFSGQGTVINGALILDYWRFQITMAMVHWEGLNLVHNMKRITSLLVAFIILFSVVTTVVADSGTELSSTIANNGDGSITVTVGSGIAQAAPTAEIYCSLADPIVKFNGVRIESSYENRAVSFKTDRDGSTIPSAPSTGTGTSTPTGGGSSSSFSSSTLKPVVNTCAK